MLKLELLFRRPLVHGLRDLVLVEWFMYDLEWRSSSSLNSSVQGSASVTYLYLLAKQINLLEQLAFLDVVQIWSANELQVLSTLIFGKEYCGAVLNMSVMKLSGAYSPATDLANAL